MPGLSAHTRFHLVVDSDGNIFPETVDGNPLNLPAGTLLDGSPIGGGGGSGSVTSVGLTAPAIFNVSSSPVTTSGNIALSLANQNANRVFAGPASGAAAAPTFRALVATDIPSLAFSSLTAIPTTLSGYGITDAQALINFASAAVIYVSKGAAATDTRGSLSKYDATVPFATLAAAKAAASTGDTIVVLPGTYNERDLLKDGVHWHFMPGAKIVATTSGAQAIFDDGTGGDQSNGYGATSSSPVTSKITGAGEFTDSGTFGTVLRLSNAGSNVIFQAAKARTTVAAAPETCAAVFRFYNPSAAASVSVKEITSDQYDAVWGGGAGVVINAESITASDNLLEEFGGVVRAVTGTTTGDAGGGAFFGGTTVNAKFTTLIQRGESTFDSGDAVIEVDTWVAVAQNGGEGLLRKSGTGALRILRSKLVHQLNHPVVSSEASGGITFENCALESLGSVINLSGDAAVTLFNTSLAAGTSSAVSVEASSAQTITAYGSTANKAVHANITISGSLAIAGVQQISGGGTGASTVAGAITNLDVVSNDVFTGFANDPLSHGSFEPGLWRGGLGLGTAATVNLGANVGTFLATPSSANLLAAVTGATGTGALVFGTLPTLITPNIGSFVNATHSHQNAAGGGTLDAAAIGSGLLPLSRGGTEAAYTAKSGVIKAGPFTVATSGGAQDIGSFSVPASVASGNYIITTVTLHQTTASGTNAAASFIVRDATGGGGTQLTTQVAGKASAGGQTTVATTNSSSATSSAGTLHVRQTADSANAGTVTLYLFFVTL